MLRATSAISKTVSKVEPLEINGQSTYEYEQAKIGSMHDSWQFGTLPLRPVGAPRMQRKFGEHCVALTPLFCKDVL